MPRSKLIDSAHRMRTIADALNNPKDRAVAASYADELAALAKIEVLEPSAIALPSNDGRGSATIVNSILKRAFQPAYSTFADDLLICMD